MKPAADITGSRAHAPRFTPFQVLLAGITVLLALTSVFLLFPGLDLAVSGAFYSPGAGFSLSNDAALIALRRSNDYLVAAVGLGLIVWLVRVGCRRAWRAAASAWQLTLLLGLLLGPGLIVNGVFKRLWGRPRPYTIDVFGGNAPYVDVWQVSNHCQQNCSFLGGESSTAAWLFAAAFLVPARWRAAAFIVLGIYAIAISLNRIAFGGHFLSDVLMSWAVVAIVLAALRAWAHGVMAAPAPRGSPPP